MVQVGASPLKACIRRRHNEELRQRWDASEPIDCSLDMDLVKRSRFRGVQPAVLTASCGMVANRTLAARRDTAHDDEETSQ